MLAPMTSTLTGPTLTLAEAMKASGRARNTIKARKDALVAAGAVVDDTGGV